MKKSLAGDRSRGGIAGKLMLVALLASFIVCAWLGFRLLLNERDLARLASCRPAVTARAAEVYASEYGGLYPPMSLVPGRFTYDTDKVKGYANLFDYMCEFESSRMPPEDLNDVDFWRLDDWSYVYLGFAIENESQGLAFLDAYHARANENLNFENDLIVPQGAGNGGGTVLYRLRTSSAFTEDLAYLQANASTIPVVIEWPGNHGKYGSKVVFLDGHTEVIPYPGKFPMTEKFITALKATDAAFPPYRP